MTEEEGNPQTWLIDECVMPLTAENKNRKKNIKLSNHRVIISVHVVLSL
jgi:hypothetical protein